LPRYKLRSEIFNKLNPMIHSVYICTVLVKIKFTVTVSFSFHSGFLVSRILTPMLQVWIHNFLTKSLNWTFWVIAALCNVQFERVVILICSFFLPFYNPWAFFILINSYMVHLLIFLFVRAGTFCILQHLLNKGRSFHSILLLNNM